MNIFTNQRKSTINPMEKYNNRFLYSTNTKDKITIFGKKYELLICFQSISNPTLNLKTDYIEICFPKIYKNYNINTLVEKKKKKMFKKIAENELDLFMDKARHVFGFAPDNYTIVDLNRPLATVIDKSEIIFSSNIVKYDKKTIEYIVFHEFCHLKYKTHSKKFYVLLEKNKPNYKVIEEQIQNLKY